MRGLFLSAILFALAVIGVSLFLSGPLGTSAGARAATQASQELMNKGLGQLQAGKYADAIRTFEAAATANPKNAEAFTYIGQSYEKAGLEDRAYRFYNIALEIDPDDLKALAWSGRLDVSGDEMDLAGEKLVRLQRLCGADCSEYRSLKMAIDNLGAEN